MREGRRVLVDEDRVFNRVDVRLSGGDGFAAPEQEDDERRLSLDEPKHGLSERLPTELGVAHGFAGAHGENEIKQENALAGPRFEIAGGGRAPVGDAAREGLKDVFERGGRARGWHHGEGQPVGVAGRGVGILPEDNDLHIGGLNDFESAKDVGA